MLSHCVAQASPEHLGSISFSLLGFPSSWDDGLTLLSTGTSGCQAFLFILLDDIFCSPRPQLMIFGHDKEKPQISPRFHCVFTGQDPLCNVLGDRVISKRRSGPWSSCQKRVAFKLIQALLPAALEALACSTSWFSEFSGSLICSRSPPVGMDCLPT